MNDLFDIDQLNIDCRPIKTHLVSEQYIDSFIKNRQPLEISYSLLLDIYQDRYFNVYRHAFGKLFPKWAELPHYLSYRFLYLFIFDSYDKKIFEDDINEFYKFCCKYHVEVIARVPFHNDILHKLLDDTCSDWEVNSIIYDFNEVLLDFFMKYQCAHWFDYINELLLYSDSFETIKQLIHNKYNEIISACFFKLENEYKYDYLPIINKWLAIFKYSKNRIMSISLQEKIFNDIYTPDIWLNYDFMKCVEQYPFIDKYHNKVYEQLVYLESRNQLNQLSRG